MQIDEKELLSRFLFDENIRQDLTIRHGSFMPPSNLKLSVTRHLDFSEDDIWNEGKRVALIRGKQLLGRADIQVLTVISLDLNVIPAPIPENPNHANITGWPSEKSARMSKAQEMAAAAGKALDKHV